MADPTPTSLLFFLLPWWRVTGVGERLCHHAALIQRATCANETAMRWPRTRTPERQAERAIAEPELMR